MSWTAPATAVALATLPASFWNTHVRDNLLETVPAKASAAGQVPYANGVNSIAMLAAVARRMPRFNAAGNALETVANLSLAQVPVFVQAASVNLTNLAFVNVVSQSFTTTGGMVLLFGTCEILENKSGSGIASQNHQSTLRRDGVSIGQVNSDVDVIAAVPFTVVSTVPLLWAETPAAGTYAYQVAATYIGDFTTGTPIGSATLLIVELAP